MSIHTASKKGRRRSNEDEHTVLTFLNPKKNPYNKYANINIYGVFDGHGGGYVSKYLHDHLHKYFISKKVPRPFKSSYINRVYDHVQGKLTKSNTSKAHACGSTCLLALHFRDKRNVNYLQLLNTGDSRGVLCHSSKNVAVRLTKDHKPNIPEERHRITQLGGQVYYDGHDYRIKDLSVSRAFGDNDSKPYVVQKPDIFNYKLNKNDKFMILACDGLWDVMSDQEAVDFVLNEQYDMRTGKRKKTSVNIANKLATHAINDKGSTDNVTTVIVFFH